MSKRDPITHRTPEQMKKLSRGYNAQPEQVKKRAERNKAREMLMKEGRVSKGDGKGSAPARCWWARAAPAS